MIEINSKDLVGLKNALIREPPSAALPKTVGDRTAGGGIWRLFSEQYPAGGILAWNSADVWRLSWPDLPSSLLFVGEDIFGNQLTCASGCENVFLWNHENGNLTDLSLDPATLLETVLQAGLDWIDFYTPEMLAVARTRLLDVPENCHLHWTQPLILGGRVSTKNTSVLETVSHMKFHAALWAKLRDLPPGTEIVAKPKP